MSKNPYARSLQLLGLIIAPSGIMLELNDKVSLGQSLVIATIGIVIFYAGYSLQPKPSG